jgi:hypothetical protein
MKILAILTITSLFIMGCSKDNPVIPPEKRSNIFAIYFLKDTTLTIKDIMNSNSYPFINNLKDLELADKPWISQDDIEFYEWSSHNIYLKKDKSHFFPQLNDIPLYRFPKSWTDRPWIVVANGVPCYAGYFGTEQSNNIYPFPEINSLIVGYLPTDILSSYWNFWFNSIDIRFNDLVKETLISCSLYHGGIEVSIDTVNHPIKVYCDTTVEYTLKFRNVDKDNIYIFDPDKMDPGIFHYYNGSPNFMNIETKECYFARSVKGKETGSLFDNFHSERYTLLKSGDSIIRTFRLRSYHSTSPPYPPSIIPPGTYLVQGSYSTPRYTMEKNIRQTSQGRYYVTGGEVHTDTVLIKITKVY